MGPTFAPGSWQAFAADATTKTTVLLAAAGLACLAARRGPASARHLAWALALVGSLTLPPLALALPAWRLPILPAAAPGPATAARPDLPVGGGAEAPAVVADAAPAAGGATVAPRAEAPAEPAPGATPLGRTAAPRAADGSWGSGIFAIWAAGVATVLVPALAGHARLGSFRGRPVDGPWDAMVEGLRARLGIRRRVALLIGDEAASPMTWGVLRPKVLLPASAEGWPPGRLRDVLLHELAHVGRWDCLTQGLARVACAAYWFHPLAWLAASRMRAERELACDDLVLRSGSKASDYAGHLLHVARAHRPASRAAVAVAVPMARPTHLEGRLRSILDGARSHRGVSGRAAASAIAAAAALVAPLAAARLDARAWAEGGSDRAEGPALMVVSGRVLDPEGRPVTGARVAAVGRRKRSSGGVRAEDQNEALGRGVADVDGSFRLDVARTSALTHYDAHVLAAAPGLGLGWAEFDRDAAAPSADVRLRPERPVELRLVDLQGEPAPGVAVRISSIGVPDPAVGRTDGLNFWERTPPGLDDVWPASLRTDADGRVRLGGIGRGVRVGLQVDDPRHARQGLSVEAEAGDGPKRATLPLQPALKVSGRVTAADTGEPIRDAVVVVGTGKDPFSHADSEYRTDAEGRFAANPAPGRYLHLVAYPPVGSPYPAFGRTLDVGDDAGRRAVDLAIPRGTLISGTIRSAGGGPLAGASVYYDDGRSNIVDPGDQATIPGWKSAVTAGPEGRYAIAVSPGKGVLAVYGPTADFVHEVKSEGELRRGKPAWSRHYAHAFVPYEATPGTDRPATDINLTPGAVLKGTVVGPEGRAVDAAEIVTTLSISPFHTTWRGDFTLPVRAGRFEIHGVPADRAVRCSFLDAEHGWGATVEVDAALAARGPLTVRLEPCGTATCRFVDGSGKPIEGMPPMFNILGNPGHGTDYYGESLTDEERGQVAADEEIYANVDRRNYWRGPRSDAAGRLTLPCLIPGATYRIYEHTPERSKNAFRPRDFAVAAGQALDLGDVRLKGPGR